MKKPWLFADIRSFGLTVSQLFGDTLCKLGRHKLCKHKHPEFRKDEGWFCRDCDQPIRYSVQRGQIEGLIKVPYCLRCGENPNN